MKLAMTQHAFPLARYSFVLLWLLWIFVLPGGSSGAESASPSPGEDETMLMFVGEELDVLSIASRREESAWQAPAVADVITKREIAERGLRTLSDALELQPGFYMAQKEWGSRPYLRGIRDSVLFLYDTVPLTSEMSKSLSPVGHELSLFSVKRIEIVRGPGSVLWGPDAFAGIVNVVPMTGKDLDGVETGVLYEHGDYGDQTGFYVNAGHDAGVWNAFLSVAGRRGDEDDSSANLVDFWGAGRPVPPEERFGKEDSGDSHYLEVSGNFSFKDWFTLSGWFSKHDTPYGISSRAEDVNSSDQDLTWLEERSGSRGFLKLESKKDLNRTSALRFAGYYSWLFPETEVIDMTLEQKEQTAYGELIYDRSFLTGKGLFTGGISYRRKTIDDAPVWTGFLPDFLGEDNPFFLPTVEEVDYNTRLWSLFGQYNQKMGDFDLWLGLRYDDHDDYEDNLSYNAGVSWSPSSQWILKLLYGTAYRTPFARQLLDEGTPDLEKIQTISAQVAWEPSKKVALNLVGFASRIDNHRIDDPYAGLSFENDQDLYGCEIEGRISPAKSLDLSANLTLVDNSGSDETFRLLDSISIDPEGNIIPIFVELSQPYDRGPGKLFNLMATWRPHERVTAYGRLGYVSSRDLIHPKSGDIGSASSLWLVDVTTTVKDIVIPGLDLQVRFKNLLDDTYKTPGTYTFIQGEGRTVEVMLKMSWYSAKW